ncbi:hypothetical protein TRFO_10718 [Tritrichomonas foetus]|uniref:PDEase domain-containing protein n=1 Tax=Tritrichomonas foetus TaxID=1144522 RepID=A0A1J4JC75_9EUKA|nr:hypothetical protein TRFO_10718 [Tritrichomonas foetus]|eukprot:OHS95013.1 hypothetical protein TRFO_10718 [Tritrichomonas foetus]
MSNFPNNSTQQRKLNKQGRPLNFLSTDISHIISEAKPATQTRPITTLSEVSQASFPSDPSSSLDDDTRLEIENYFDELLEKISILPFHSAVEPILTTIFNAHKTVLWVSKGRAYSYFSPTLDKYIVGEDSLISAAARARTSIVCPPSMDFSSTEDQSDNECSKMYFPFYLKTGTVVAVAEVYRSPLQDPFEDDDLKISAFLMKKFLLYGSAVFSPSETVSFASEFSHITTPLEANMRLSNALIRGFNCKMTDFWCHHENTKDLLKFDTDSGDFLQPPKSNIGVVTAAIRNKTTVNSKTARYHPNFSFNGDPLPDEPVLISTFTVDDCVFAAVLRGRIVQSPFSADDESKLEAIMPFIARSLLFSTTVGQKGVSSRDPFELELTDLLDAAALFAAQITFDDLAKVIQEKSASLTQAQACKLYLYNHVTNQLTSDFDQNNPNLHSFSASEGLVGSVASLGTPIRLKDPTSDPRFHEIVDVGASKTRNNSPSKRNRTNLMNNNNNNNNYLNGVTAESLKSIMIIPIFTSMDSVIGAIALYNKNNRLEFTDDDEKIMTTIAVFASISIQNSKIFQMSLNLAQHLSSFTHFTHDRTKIHSDDSFLIKLLKKARDELKAYRVTLFFSRNNKTLILYRSIGGPPEDGSKYSLPAAQQGNIISYPIQETPEILPPTTNSSARRRTSDAISQPVSSRTDAGTSPSPNNRMGRIICCSPIIDINNDMNKSGRDSNRETEGLNDAENGDKNENVLAVLEICIPSIGSPEDIEIFETFCKIVVLAIKQKSLKELKETREEMIALQDTLTENERENYSIPSKYKAVPKNIFTNEFDITLVEDEKLLNIAFACFDKFGLMHEFNIIGAKLFLFLYRIQKLNGDEWRHALDSTAFLSYLLTLTRFDEKLQKNEILALLIASLCHNLGSSFFPTTFTNRADNALELLFSKSPVFEEHSCAETISIISSPEINLLESMDEETTEYTNNLIIKLILSTDFFRHFELMHELKVRTNNEQFDWTDAENTLLLMKIFLKCADVGVIAKIPIVADKFKNIVCNEYFQHGPIDKPKDLIFKSKINRDRSHLDKDRSRRSVLNSVFAPMFRILQKIYQQLEDMNLCISENINKWTGLQSDPNSNINTDEGNKSGGDGEESPESNEEEEEEETSDDNAKLGPDRLLEAD